MKVANKLDSIGLTKEADTIDALIRKIGGSKDYLGMDSFSDAFDKDSRYRIQSPDEEEDFSSTEELSEDPFKTLKVEHEYAPGFSSGDALREAMGKRPYWIKETVEEQRMRAAKGLKLLPASKFEYFKRKYPELIQTLLEMAEE